MSYNNKSNDGKAEDDDRKIFVGGITRETTTDDLEQYFSKYGDVEDVSVKRDPNTGQSRGFGFVLFVKSSSIDKVIESRPHFLNGKTIDPKRAMARGALGEGTKIFVGGLDPNMAEQEIRDHFCQYGQIENIELPFDKNKNMRRGFGFITFSSEESVNKVVAVGRQRVGSREVDIRKATPKSDHSNFSGGSSTDSGQVGGQSNPPPNPNGYPGAPYDYSSYYGQSYPGYGYYPGYPYPYSGYPGYNYPYPYSGSYPGYPGYYPQQPPATGAPDCSSSSAAGNGGGNSGGGDVGKMKSAPQTGQGHGYHPYAR